MRECEAGKATSSAPFELSRTPHSRFGTCVGDPVAVFPKSRMISAGGEVEEDEDIAFRDEDVPNHSDSGADSSPDENVDMKWEESRLEEARNYEPDAAAGSHGVFLLTHTRLKELSLLTPILLTKNHFGHVDMAVTISKTVYSVAPCAITETGLQKKPGCCEDSRLFL
jgi:hypothetical protein